MGDGITIRLEVYLPFRGKRLWRGEETVPAGTTAGALLGHLGLIEPGLTVLVNARNRGMEVPLQHRDEVAILRQTEGGGV